MRRQILLLGTLVLATLTVVSAAEQTTSAPGLVYSHVTVVDAKGRFIIGLEKEQFKVVEDNIAQEIASFSSRTPISVGIMVDVRGTEKDQVTAAALSAFRRADQPANEVLLFDSSGKSLSDAVESALRDLSQRKNGTRALVLFTTRYDPAATSFAKVKDLLKSEEIRLYAIALQSRTDPTEDRGRSLLTELSEINGGQAFFAPSLLAANSIFGSVHLEMLNGYVIGYQPSNTSTDGKWRKIKVTAESPVASPGLKLTVRAKAGYYALKP